MLFGKMWVGHGDAHSKEVESDLPVRAIDKLFPMFFVAVRVVEDEK